MALTIHAYIPTYTNYSPNLIKTKAGKLKFVTVEKKNTATDDEYKFLR